MPRYAQLTRGLTNASDKTPMPTTTRTMRSTFPMFAFMTRSSSFRRHPSSMSRRFLGPGAPEPAYTGETRERRRKIRRWRCGAGGYAASALFGSRLRKNGRVRSEGIPPLAVSRPPELAEIYESYHRKVVAYAAKLLGRDHAEDIAQEVFIKVSRAL